ncbi:MAG: Ig-like domain-containing protein, partial [Acidimicrobiia bacterium]|nr:Ig-like domain-containing protein [Acidimicrobiia bacterium]
ETLMAATGPAFALPCANAAFTNSSGQPLGTQAWDHTGIYTANEFTLAAGEVKSIWFDVELRPPPVAVDDTASVANGGTVKIPVTDNDSNPEGEAVDVIKTSDPAHGSAVWSLADGFIYTHDGSNTTVDSFTYKLADSVLESPPATVTISIAALPPLPLVAPTVGLQDPASGQWHLRDETGIVTTFYFGNPGDVAFMGDWNCDGIDTPGLFRMSDAYAYLRNFNTQGIADIRFFFGNPSDVPLAGDFNGDGCDTLSIYRPSAQAFYIMNRLGENEGGLGAADYSFIFGNPGDKPVVGDWDGDGIDEIGLHRESSGFFYFRNTLTTGIAHGQFYFGDPGDRFVAGDWGIVDGAETPAVFRPGNTRFYFRNTLTPGNADSSFPWGLVGLMPVAGNFGDLPGGGGITPPPSDGLPVDGMFTGPLIPQTGVSGDVRFEVGSSGTVVSDPVVHLVFDGYQCGPAKITSDGHATVFATVPIAGMTFSVTNSQASWQGTFSSAVAASGTVSGQYQLGMGGTSCAWGPISWTASR